MATTITPTIVTLNTVVTEAPEPNQLQQSCALISLGATTLTSGSYQYCGSLSAVTAILESPAAGNSAELTNMATTWFAQGSVVGVYVLELGTETTPGTNIAALNTWITNNPAVFYSFVVPADWDSASVTPTLATTVANYSSSSGKTYFFVTTTQADATKYASTKSVIASVTAPSAASTEFLAAAIAYNWTVNQPSGASPLAPMQYRQLYGVTPWPAYGQSAAIDAILSADANIAYSGTEGGLPNSTYLWGGHTMDGKQATFWYAVDWYQIQSKQALANAIINASNQNPPIVYNQQGINALETVLQNVGNSSIAFGLMLSVALTAQSFATYTTQNPSNYAAGIYGGFAATVTPQAGFESITFTIDATTFA